MKWWFAFTAGCLLGIWGLAYRIWYRDDLKLEEDLIQWQRKAWEDREQRLMTRGDGDASASVQPRAPSPLRRGTQDPEPPIRSTRV
jgi:hypothetical protein